MSCESFDANHLHAPTCREPSQCSAPPDCARVIIPIFAHKCANALNKGGAGAANIPCSPLFLLRMVQMMDALARVVFENPHGLMACDLSNLLRSFAVLGMLPFAERSAMYTILIRSAIMRLHDFTPLELANVTWALACLDPPDDILGNDDVRLISARAEEMFQPSSTDVALLCQLHQWQLWLQERGDTSHGLSCSLRASALEAFSATVPTTSHLQMLVGMDLAGIAQVTPLPCPRAPRGGDGVRWPAPHFRMGSTH